jgi:hypothetical protein
LRHAERGEQRLRAFRFAARLIENTGIAPREGDLRFGEAAGEHCRFDHALGGLVERRGAARAADKPVLGATQHDETRGRRRSVEIGAREAVLERQDQRVPKWREPRDEQEDRADADEAPPPPRPARPDQDRAIADEEGDERRRLQQEPQPLGEIEEHRKPPSPLD